MRSIRNIEKYQPFAGFMPPAVSPTHPSETLKERDAALTPAAPPQGGTKTKYPIVFSGLIRRLTDCHKSFARL
jgi:hypothetical protein